MYHKKIDSMGCGGILR